MTHNLLSKPVRVSRAAAALFVSLVAVTLWQGALAGQLLAKAKDPLNIVLIFTDDQGYGDVGCYGAQGVATPNLDQMAKEGMRFTDFYVGCPVCSGSRTALLTGCHYQRVKMGAVLFPRSNIGLHPDEITIAEVLKSQGYATACVGKWHLGHLPPFLPTKQGFDYYYGIPYSNDMWIDPNARLAKDILLREGVTLADIKEGKTPRNKVPLMRGEEVIEYPADQSTLTKRYTQEAIQFISQHKDKPFFVYLPHTMCHYPLAASEEFRGRTKRGVFGDVIEELDWSVGKILTALKEMKLDEKTLVIFTTDNGPAPGSSGPLRAKKASMYEGGIRVPCIMRWPGQIPAGKECREVAATIDLLPTLAQLTGAKAPSDRTLDGRDIWPLMSGQADAKSPHDAYVLLHGGGAVRSGQWKFYPWPEKKGKGKQAAADPQGPKVQLYDLSQDLSETKNLAGAHPDVVRRLAAAHKALADDIKKNGRPVGRVEMKK